MSFIKITPEQDTWQDKTEPYTISFCAYDDTNTRIRNKQIYIVYDMRMDNTEPDLTSDHAKKVYGDGDGIIKIQIYTQCRISIDLFHVKIQDNLLDRTKLGINYVQENICSNLFIPFEPYIKKFVVSYTGKEKITVTEPIPTSYVYITKVFSDGTTKKTVVSKDYYNISFIPDTIQYTESNTITVLYHENLTNKDWSGTITIFGKDKEIKLIASYNQDKIYKIGDTIDKNDINVLLKLFNGHDTITRKLNNKEWNFATLPIINEINCGIFNIARNNLITSIRIKYNQSQSKYKIDAWYEGPDILVGKLYNPNDLRIFLYSQDKPQVLTLKYEDVIIEPNDRHILKEGINWFTVKYRDKNYIIQDKVAIRGYVKDKYNPRDFLLEYYDENTHSITDVTEDFEYCTLINDKRYFNWLMISDKIKEDQRFGKYLLRAPANSGLNTRFDTEWIIECYKNNNLSASLNKILLSDKEDNSNAKDNQKES